MRAGKNQLILSHRKNMLMELHILPKSNKNPSSSNKNNQKPKKTSGGRFASGFHTTGVLVSAPMRQLSLLPTKLMQTLRYTQSITMTTGTSGSTSASQQAFRILSLFDPDLSGVGHQPYGFDQLAALYLYYQVKKVRAEFVFDTIGASSDIVAILAVYSSASGSSATVQNIATENAIERPGCSTVMLSASGNSRNSKISMDIHPHVIEGLTLQQYMNNPNYKSTVSASPTLNPLLILVTGSPSGASSVTCNAICTFYFETEFSAPIVLGPS